MTQRQKFENKILGQEIKEDNKNSWGQQLAAGFLFQFCDYAKVAIISKVIQPNLVTCTNMEVGKNQNPLTFLATLGTNNKNLAIGRFFFRNLANLGQFFHGKSFLYVEIIIFR